MMPVVPVKLITKAGNEVTTNCFLDVGSSGSFITEGLVQRLGLQGEEVDISLDTVTTQEMKVKSSIVDGLKVGALSGGKMFPLPPLFTLGNLPITVSDRCQPAEVAAWPHLSGVNLEVLERPVELMLGSNVAELLVAREVKAPLEGPGPVGVRSHLGWHVIGSAGGGSRQRPHRVNFLRLIKPVPRRARPLVPRDKDKAVTRSLGAYGYAVKVPPKEETERGVVLAPPWRRRARKRKARVVFDGAG